MSEAPPDLTSLPIFPLGTVLFPGGLLPLRVFETRYVDMTRAALKSKQPFGVCLIRAGREVGEAAEPEPIGTLAHIVECDMQQLGLLTLKTRGGRSFRILEHHSTPQGLVRASVELLDEEADVPLEPRFEPCAAILRMVIAEQPHGIFLEPHRLDSTSWVGRRLAEILPIPMSAKQKLLELDDGPSRLEVLYRFLEQRGLLAGK
jgi:uncharacterized protein